MPSDQAWITPREELKRCFSCSTKLDQATVQLEYIAQKPNESLHLCITYMLKYIIQQLIGLPEKTQIHRSFKFPASIYNTTISDKISRSETLHKNLQESFERDLILEAGYQAMM